MNAFDRGLARGPWRLPPAPSFLADAGAGIAFQLVWAAVLVGVLVTLCGVALGVEPAMVSPYVAELVWRGSLTTMLFAVGQAVVFSRGGFDFGMGPVAVFAALVAISFESPALGVAAALVYGVAIGLLVAMLRVPGWLLTGAAAFVLTPAARASFPGGPIRTLERLPPWTPAAAGALLVLAAAGAFAIAQLGPRSPLARSWRARLADGVPYVFSAALAGVAGIAMAHRTGGLSGAFFTSTWVEVLAVVVLGGTWLGSGRANVVGTLVAAFLLQALRFGLTWLGVDPYMQLALVRALAVLGIAVSIAVHVAWARRCARAPAPAPAAVSPPAHG